MKTSFGFFAFAKNWKIGQKKKKEKKKNGGGKNIFLLNLWPRDFRYRSDAREKSETRPLPRIKRSLFPRLYFGSDPWEKLGSIFFFSKFRFFFYFSCVFFFYFILFLQVDRLKLADFCWTFEIEPKNVFFSSGSSSLIKSKPFASFSSSNSWISSIKASSAKKRISEKFVARGKSKWREESCKKLGRISKIWIRKRTFPWKSQANKWRARLEGNRKGETASQSSWQRYLVSFYYY